VVYITPSSGVKQDEISWNESIESF
jgi:hypothetical protein